MSQTIRHDGKEFQAHHVVECEKFIIISAIYEAIYGFEFLTMDYHIGTERLTTRIDRVTYNDVEHAHNMMMKGVK